MRIKVNFWERTLLFAAHTDMWNLYLVHKGGSWEGELFYYVAFFFFNCFIHMCLLLCVSQMQCGGQRQRKSICKACPWTWKLNETKFWETVNSLGSPDSHRAHSALHAQNDFKNTFEYIHLKFGYKLRWVRCIMALLTVETCLINANLPPPLS